MTCLQVKCHKYWPEELNRPMLYGDIRVTNQESLVLAAYTVRTFSLHKEGFKNERIVRQFHFTIWPDHGVPEEPSPLLHFVRKVTQSNSQNAGPMVVHCSAGVGRTGTFISIHSQLLRMQNESNLDIFNFVQSMRKRRCFMVQTEVVQLFSFLSPPLSLNPSLHHYLTPSSPFNSSFLVKSLD